MAPLQCFTGKDGIGQVKLKFRDVKNVIGSAGLASVAEYRGKSGKYIKLGISSTGPGPPASSFSKAFEALAGIERVLYKPEHCSRIANC